jgi:D-tyrosyl-tRNA(Tyr) deacylase
MKAVIQRVTSASVSIEGEVKGQIGKGLMILLGITHDDSNEDIQWLARKLVNLRIFSDQNGIMNLSLVQIDGELLIISQFTLHANTKKGNRPSYIKAAPPHIAIPLYEAFIEEVSNLTGKQPATGEFGADMQVALVNDGPVTITIDTKNKL